MRWQLFILVTVVLACRCAQAEDFFELSALTGEGRTVAAELVELNGDGRTDVLRITFAGVPPDDTREIRVHLQGDDGRLPTTPSFTLPLPANASAYDLGDLRPTPGTELLLLRPSDAVVLSLDSASAQQWTMAVPGGRTIFAARDERGFERLQIVSSAFGLEPLLLIPQLGELAVMQAGGEIVAQLATGARANYLVPATTTLLFIESELQLYLDYPRISVGDVDGDGAADIVTANRHEVRVFPRKADGSFAREPERVHLLHLVSEQDHIRSSGSVGVQARDVDGDGRLDLLISHLSGSLANARLDAALYLNRSGTWNLDRSDGSLTTNAALGSDTLLDVDGDGRLELLRSIIPFSILELVEALLTRSVDAKLTLYRPAADGSLPHDGWATVKLEVPLSFETFRPRGFLPTWHADLNGDGHLDLLDSGGGEAVEVHLGGAERRYQRRDTSQETDTGGLLRTGDLDNDGLPDLIIFDPLRPAAPVRILRNRGQLPGTVRGNGPAAPPNAPPIRENP